MSKAKEETKVENLKLEKIKENEQKFKENNENIEKLIKNFNGYLKKMKNVLKVNRFFNEFDDKIGQDLKALVKLSTERYKSVKSGNTIFQVLEEQSPVLCTLIHSALNDPFYRTKEIMDEKKKIKGKAINQKEMSEIAHIRSKINSKPMTANGAISMIAKSSLSPVKEMGERRTANLPDKENVTNYLKEDNIYLTQKFSEYGNFLNEKKNNLKLKEDDTKKKFALNIGDLKYVSSQLNPVMSVIQKIRMNQEIDTHKLITIQKGQKEVQERRLKNKEILFDEKFTKLLEKDVTFEENNHLSTIKNEILKTTKFKENILVKAGKLNHILHEKQYPQIDEYEKRIERNNKKQDKKPVENSLQKIKKERAVSNQIRDKRYRAYQDQFNKKKADWKVKDEIEDNMKKVETQNKEKRRQFMKEIDKVPRTAQIFIDNYSLRDDETNKNIIEINRILKRQHIDKTKVNTRIDDFLIELEERKKNYMMEFEKMTEVHVEGEYNIKEQMKKNLENEINSNTERDNYILKTNNNVVKVPIDMSNQTVTENFNVFKQYRDKILDKNQQEVHKIKPMTAGEFLNDNSKMNPQSNNVDVNVNKGANYSRSGVQGLANFLKGDPREIKKKLEDQIPSQVVLSQMNNISKSIKKNNPLIEMEVTKEGYFGKNRMNNTNKDFYIGGKNIQNPFKNRNEDIFESHQQIINLVKTESNESKD